MKGSEEAHAGTAGEMLDFSLAGGLGPTVSSFSRIVFSDATILLVAMSLCDGPGSRVWRTKLNQAVVVADLACLPTVKTVAYIYLDRKCGPLSVCH